MVRDPVNAASAGIEVGAGAALYALLSPHGGITRALAAAAAAGVLVHLLNVSAVAGVVAAQRSLRYGPVSARHFCSNLGEHLIMFTGGGLLAACLQAGWLWTLAILLIVALYFVTWQGRSTMCNV